MAPKITDLGRRLGKLAAKIRQRNETDGNTKGNVINTADEGLSTQPQASISAEALPAGNQLRSILEYAPGKWMEQSSPADTSSSIAEQKELTALASESSSLHAIGDPSYRVRNKNKTRDTDNWAVQRISSVLSTRSDSSFYYNRYGNPRPVQKGRKRGDQNHYYCCPSSRELQKGKRNLFPYEEIDADWQIQALKDCKAGQWSIDDFSEQHLLDRLFFNANIVLPNDHLEGAQKAAAQELRAVCVENNSLTQSSIRAGEHANSLEDQLNNGKEKVQQLDMEIKELRSLWEAHLRK